MDALPNLTLDERSALHAQDAIAAPYLAYRDGADQLCLLALLAQERVVVGRSAQSDLTLPWDTAVSRAHALLELVGGEWAVVDDGMSRNGTHLNGHRVAGRRRLNHGDVLTFGGTRVQFRQPLASSPADPSAETADVADMIDASILRPAQRRVLVALCRPLASGRVGALPASNQEIADDLSISLDGVRTQMRTLYERLDVPELPQARKRAALAQLALETGLVTSADLADRR